MSYYLYSSSQAKLRSDNEAKLGKFYKPGIIIINGKRLQFTEINTTGKSIYSDARIVYSGAIGGRVKVVSMPNSSYSR